MTLASIILFLAAGLGQLPELQHAPKGNKILIDTLWAHHTFDIPVEYLVAQPYLESRHTYWAKSVVRSNGFWDSGYFQVNIQFVEDLAMDFRQTMGFELSTEEKRQVNVMLGAFVLSRHYKEFKNWTLAFQAYNGGAGPGRTRTQSTEVRA